MTSTKTAIVALMALTVDSDRGPAWLRLLGAIVQLGCVAYLMWYVWWGPEPRESKRSKR